MVFYRKYRRTGRSYVRRGRSRYSMYKLYKSRSSGAQARQIYGLNMKLRRIQRLTKPEINIAPLVQGSCLSSQGGTETNGVRIFGPINLTNLSAEGETAPSGSTEIQGRFARLQNITLKGILSYATSGTASTFDQDLQRMVGYMRIVLVQTKVTRGADISYSDIFSNSIAGSASTSGTVSALTAYSMIRAPLRYGTARVVKILSDKSYMLSDTKQAVNVKTKLKYVKNWYKAPNENGPKGQVFMFVMLYNQDADAEDNVSDIRFDYISKCVYTDA